MDSSEEGSLAQREWEAAAWCALKGDPEHPATSFRSEALDPGRPLVQCNPSVRTSVAERHRIVRTLVAQRRKLLEQRGIVFPANPAVPAGRRLLCEVDCSDWATLSTDASSGFFDDYDIPAWDTWVDVDDEGNLLCWIPESITHHVDAGMWVNPVECLRWLDQSGTRVSHRLFLLIAAVLGSVSRCIPIA